MPVLLPTDDNSESTDAAVRYRVYCINCDSEFDALKSPWCSCLVKQRSVVCPECNRCFCTAPPAYKTAFWTGAPEEMWQRKSEEKAAASNTAEPVPLTHPLVLVADDDADVRAVARRVIGSLGVGLILAADGVEALDLVKQHRPEIVLTDALMPRVDGRDLCLQIKTDPELAGTYVVVMSSVYNSKKFRFETIADFKADEYLSKPIALERMQELLNSHLTPTADGK